MSHDITQSMKVPVRKNLWWITVKATGTVTQHSKPKDTFVN